MDNNNYFEAPSNIAFRDHRRTAIFLAGSINNGITKDWNSSVASKLIIEGFTVFNPRKKNWDPNLKNDFLEPVMYQQISWEDNALKESDYILFYFDGDGVSPISLLEFGKYLTSGKILMVCSPNFYRKANIDFECSKYGVPQFSTLDDAVKYLIDNINIIKK